MQHMSATPRGLSNVLQLVGMPVLLLLGPFAAAPKAPEPERQLASPEDDRIRRIDSAVERGLRWLAVRQQDAGCWTGDVGHKQGDSYALLDSARRQSLDGEGHVGVTAICGLAFLANGHVPGRGPCARVLDDTIDYLLSNQGDFGYLHQSESRMYSHAFATLFLSQVRGMTRQRSEQVDRALRSAVGFLEKTQNHHGAWRYTPFTVEADLSVTVCQVQALRAARNAGIHVSSDCIDRVIDYVRDSRIPAGRYEGAFFYKIHGRSAFTKTSFTINAAAITALHSAGVYDEAEYGGGLRFVEENYHDVSRQYPHHFYYWYGNYYAAQALHMTGGQRWDRYWDRLSEDLLSRQRSDGSWHNSVGPGDVFSTAMACLLLRVPAQVLPIWAR